MNSLNHRDWNFLCWNIRGMNSVNKWNALRQAIDDSHCDIICLQETKRDHIDKQYLKNVLPKRFADFLFVRLKWGPLEAF